MARVLIDKGVGYYTMVALIIGGAGASISSFQEPKDMKETIKREKFSKKN